MTAREELLQLFRNISVWQKGGIRAPHKPLLILYALAKCSRNEERAIPYREIDRDLRSLLIEFGPSRKSYHPEYPFWWLQSDGIWMLWNANDLASRRGRTDPKRSEFLKNNVLGGFTDSIYEAFRTDQELVKEVTEIILDLNFPVSLHEDILNAIGLSLGTSGNKLAKRDSTFRFRVISAYEHRCAVCGFDVRLADSDLALEAAHIKWFQAGGPSTENNGLALCVLHHKMFDRGALSITADHRILVSQQVYGHTGLSEWLLRYNGTEIFVPQSPVYLPRSEYTEWHRREVFRGPAKPDGR